MKDFIISALNRICGADEGEITEDTELFESGILDSFGIVQLFVELEAEGVTVDIAELDRDAISTPAKIAALAERSRNS